jgi:hypothetical protein
VEPTPTKPVHPPSEIPAYQGRIRNWISGSAIVVPLESGGGTILLLYGVRDIGDNLERAADIRRLLNAYLDENGHHTACYKRGANPRNPRYQCFVGTQDIALWAVENRLAVAAPDAPPEYRRTAR